MYYNEKSKVKVNYKEIAITIVGALIGFVAIMAFIWWITS